MTATFRVNGLNLAALPGGGQFLVDRDSTGFRDAPARSPARLALLEVAGDLLTTPAPVPGRELRVQGQLLHPSNTPQALKSAETELKDWVQGWCQMLLDYGGGTRLLAEGVCTGVAVTPRNGSHPLTALALDVTLAFRCRDAVWRAVEPTILHLATAGTRYAIRLRSAAVTPLLFAVGAASPTNPTFTYRDASGTPRRILSFPAVALAAEDWLEISMRRRRVWQVRSGVRTAAETTWEGDFSWSCDPRDGYPTAGIYPTIEISAGTGRMIYWETEQ